MCRQSIPAHSTKTCIYQCILITKFKRALREPKYHQANTPFMAFVLEI